MTEPADIFNGAVDLPDPQVWEARIATSPEAVADEVYVTIPAFDERDGDKHRFGPCSWDERTYEDGLRFPKRGDHCIVAIPATDEGDRPDPTIINWTPRTARPLDVEFAIGGGGGGDKDFTFDQGTPATVWGPINHGFGRPPSVIVRDQAGDEHEAFQVELSANETELQFTAAIMGTAHLS